MRVLAVSQILYLVEDQRQSRGEALGRHLVNRSEVARHHGVVARGVRENLGGEPRSRGQRGAPIMCFQLVQQHLVVGRIDGDRDRFVILRRCTQHGGAADVDVFHCVRVSTVRSGNVSANGYRFTTSRSIG